MADKKPAPKGAPKPAPKPSSAEGQMVFIGVIALVVVLVILPTLMKFFGYGDTKLIPDNAGVQISYAFNSFVQGLSFVSFFITFIFILLIAYAKVQYKEITTTYGDILKKQESIQQGIDRGGMQGAGVQGGGFAGGQGLPGGLSGADMQDAEGGQNFQNFVPPEPDPRWLEIQKHMNSYNQSEWRIAILEADILLYDMLSQMGYPGDTIGDMLKQADESSFVTLQDAWKAHRIRNTIAHEGASYELTRDEAERAIRLYQKVFEEFYFV